MVCNRNAHFLSGRQGVLEAGREGKLENGNLGRDCGPGNMVLGQGPRQERTG